MSGELTVGVKSFPWQLEDEDVRMEFDTRFRRSESGFKRWREDVRRYFSMYANDPWPEAVKAAMAEDNRPLATFNFSIGTVNAVLGQEQSDRKEPRFQGAQGDTNDEFVGEIMTRAVRHIYSLSKIHAEDSQAQLDQLLSGYGWMEGFVDVNRFPTRVRAEYVPVFEMFPDPEYRRENMADARYLIRARRWAIDDAAAKWPDKADELRGLVLAGATQGEERNHPSSVMGSAYLLPPPGEDPLEKENRVWVFDYQFRRKEPWVAFDHPDTGETLQVPKREWAKLEKEFLDARDVEGLPLYDAIETFAFSRDVFYRAWLAGGISHSAILLEPPARIEEDMFTYRCATGFKSLDKDTGRTIHFGLAAVIYEPQLWSSKALSSAIEYIARGAKDTWVVTDGTFENAEAAAAQRSRSGATLIAENGADLTAQIRQMNSPQWHEGLGQILRLATDAVPSTSNVTEHTRGQVSRQERSEALVSNLQSHAMAVLNPILEPMAAFRAEIGLLIAKLVQKHVPKRDFNRIVGKRELEGVTYETVIDPMTGQPAVDPQTREEIHQPILQPVLGRDGKPVVDPTTGQPASEPVTPWDLIQNQDLFEFTITVDLGTASVTAKSSLWRLLTETAALQELIQDRQVRAMLLPFMFRNIPGFPAEQAKEFSAMLERALRQSELAGTFQGVIEGIQTMPPDQLMQLQQVLGQMMQQQGLAAPTEEPVPA